MPVTELALSAARPCNDSPEAHAPPQRLAPNPQVHNLRAAAGLNPDLRHLPVSGHQAPMRRRNQWCISVRSIQWRRAGVRFDLQVNLRIHDASLTALRAQSRKSR